MTVKEFPGGKRIVRETLPSEATAWQWLGERRRLELADGRVLLRCTAKRSLRGNRYEAEVVTASVEWLREKKQERDAKRAPR